MDSDEAYLLLLMDYRFLIHTSHESVNTAVLHFVWHPDECKPFLFNVWRGWQRRNMYELIQILLPRNKCCCSKQQTFLNKIWWLVSLCNCYLLWYPESWSGLNLESLFFQFRVCTLLDLTRESELSWTTDLSVMWQSTISGFRGLSEAGKNLLETWKGGHIAQTKVSGAFGSSGFSWNFHKPWQKQTKPAWESRK